MLLNRATTPDVFWQSVSYGSPALIDRIDANDKEERGRHLSADTHVARRARRFHRGSDKAGAVTVFPQRVMRAA
jgi:hypothetical protein